MMRFSKPGWCLLGSVALIILIVALLIAKTGRQDRLPFDPAIWKAAHGDRSSQERLAMIEDLLSAHLRGKQRVEIESVLGAPGPQNYFRDYDLMYRLGKGGLLKQFRFLVLRFDRSGACVAAKVLSD